MREYPTLSREDLNEILETLKFMIKERKNDVNDFFNLKNVFISGRKVAKIPTGASDIIVTDRIGDFSFDTSYIYIVVDNTGTAEWRRATLAS